MAKNKGFTLIEIIVTITIVIILSAITIPQYLTYNAQVKLKKEGAKLASVIELAKKKSINSDISGSATGGNPPEYDCPNFSGYRVTVFESSYDMAIGCSGNYSTVQNYTIDDNISVTEGLGNMLFPPLGVNINLSTSTIRLRNDRIDMCFDIKISPIGIVTTDNILISCN